VARLREFASGGGLGEDALRGWGYGGGTT
jgi:hypothetical protein